jgi:hypothetical protein
MIKSPLELEWQEGEVPPVSEVPYDCRILFWGDYGGYENVGVIRPWGDNLNPLRWHCDMPHWGFEQPKGWWAWLKRGSEPIPSHIKLTW